jgi:CheY-like chemotaxis protein
MTAQSSRQNERRPATNPSSPKALIVDDNPVVRSFLRIKLEAGGWLVSEASDAAEGLKVFREARPDLVTLDLVMPNDGMDAVQFAWQMKQEAPEVKVLVVSGVASRRGIKDFFAKRELEVFDKPAGPATRFAELFARIDQVYHELSNRPH